MLSAILRLRSFARCSVDASRLQIRYTSTVVPKHKQWARVGISNQDDVLKLFQLAMQYLRHPYQANSVKELVLQYPVHRDIIGREGEIQAMLRDHEEAGFITCDPLLCRHVQRLGLENSTEEEWIRALSWMHSELYRSLIAAMECRYTLSRGVPKIGTFFAQYVAGLFLTLCPRIETLVYEDGHNRVLEDLLLQNNYGKLNTSHLQRLRTVQFLPDDDYGGILSDERFYVHFDILQRLRLVHRLPAIERISVDTVENNGDTGYLEHFPPTTSNIKSICLTHNIYASAELAALIRVPKALEEFTCKTGGRATIGGYITVRFPKSIGKALLCQKASLRVLDLDMDDHFTPLSLVKQSDVEGDDEEYEVEYGTANDKWHRLDEEISPGPPLIRDLKETRVYNDTIGSLHDFEKLTHLSIGVKYLLGQRKPYGQYLPVPYRLVDALPPNLEYLLIRGYKEGDNPIADAQITEFLALKDERYPLLKEIHGIETTIPSGETVFGPDENIDKLWQPVGADGSWLALDHDS